MPEQDDSSTPRTPWHQFLGRQFELTIGLAQVQVESEVQISSEPPRIDVVLLRRETDSWTDVQRTMLPDGIRDTTAGYILLEFKYSESLSDDAILQAISYEYFYRTSRGLSTEDVRIYILCAKTPHASRLAGFDFEASDLPGVYQSQNRYISHVTLLVLNQLRAAPHNALVKTFASRHKEKTRAFALLKKFWQLSTELRIMLDGLHAIWSLPEEVNMSDVLTIEKVMEIGEESKRILLKNLSQEELDDYVDPEYKQRVRNQGIEQGIEQGRKAMQTTLEQLLQTRFGTITAEVSTALSACSIEQLQTLFNPALDMPNIEEFLTAIPQPNQQTDQAVDDTTAADGAAS